MIKLHIPGEPPKALRWTVHDPRSSYGTGVLIYRNSRDMLDGAAFRFLRDQAGAWIETDRPDRVRSALALMQDESLGRSGKPAHPNTRAALLAAASRPKPDGWGKRANEWMRRTDGPD